MQCSPFIMLCFGSIEIDHVISELCYKGTILQKNYRKMTILWSFSYNSFVKFCGKKIGATTCPYYIRIHVIMRCIIKGLRCIHIRCYNGEIIKQAIWIALHVGYW